MIFFGGRKTTSTRYLQSVKSLIVLGWVNLSPSVLQKMGALVDSLQILNVTRKEEAMDRATSEMCGRDHTAASAAAAAAAAAAAVGGAGGGCVRVVELGYPD